MKISKESFFSIGTDLHIPKEQLNSFWVSLEKDDSSESTPFAKFLFYLGALSIIFTMTWLINLGWQSFGGGGLFLIGISYALIFALLGAFSWDRKGLRIPAGLLITMAVFMIPLAIYGLETYFNFWPGDYPGQYQNFYHWVRTSWIYMEIGTLSAGLIAFHFYSFPFLIAPIFFSSWFLTLDILPLIFRYDMTWEQRYWVSLCFGILWMVFGFVADQRNKEDYGFWYYLFGTILFSIGLNCLIWDKGELVLFIFFLINVMMMCLSIILRRNILMICGALGTFTYLAHLAYNIFKDSILFPFVVSLIGLGIIYLGVLYQRNFEWNEKNILEKLPSFFRK